MTNKPSSDKKYGINPPELSLSEAVRIVEQIYKLAGGEVSRSQLAEFMGTTELSSLLVKKILALKKLGLLISEGKSFFLTNIANKIASPSSPTERPESLKMALLNSDTLLAIYERYKGGVLPQGEFLANWIKQNTGIPDKLKNAWANYFRKAAETAGLLMLRQDGTAQLRSNPIVQNADWTGVSKEPIGEEKKIENQPPSNTPRDAFVVDKLFAGLEGGSLATYILSGDKKALFFIPDGLSVSDAKKLEPAIKALEQQIQALMAASSDGLETKRENEID